MHRDWSQREQQAHLWLSKSRIALFAKQVWYLQTDMRSELVEWMFSQQHNMSLNARHKQWTCLICLFASDRGADWLTRVKQKTYFFQKLFRWSVVLDRALRTRDNGHNKVGHRIEIVLVLQNCSREFSLWTGNPLRWNVQLKAFIGLRDKTGIHFCFPENICCNNKAE